MTWLVAIAGLVAIKMSLLLLVGGRWGYHRDEPYYVVGGQHLAWGYVDHPPLTPALARLSHRIFDSSLVGFRLLPALVSSSVLVVAAGTARQLSGSDTAAMYAAVAAFACPVLLASGHWFQTVPFDQLFGSLAMLVWLHLLGGGDSLWWLVFGLLIGIGLQNKWTMLMVVGATGLGTLLDGDLRGDLVSTWFWGGVLLALLVWAPNLRWQMQRGWPTVEFVRNNSSAYHDQDGWAGFVWQQLGVLGVPLIVLSTVGLSWAWGESGWRPAAVGVAAVLVALTAIGAKAYYHGAFLPFLFAAGAVAVDGWVDSSQAVMMGAVVVWGVLAIPLVLPVLPPGTAANLGILSFNGELAEELGWPELVDQVASVLKDLPEEDRATARVITRSYAEAAAVELLGPRRGIPVGVGLSGHNSYLRWWPDDEPKGTVVAIWFDPAVLAPFFDDCERVAHVRNDVGVKNRIAGAPIVVCRGLKVSPEKLKEGLRFTR